MQKHTLGWLRQPAVSEQLSFLDRQDNSLPQLLDQVVEPSYVLPVHLHKEIHTLKGVELTDEEMGVEEVGGYLIEAVL